MSREKERSKTWKGGKKKQAEHRRRRTRRKRINEASPTYKCAQKTSAGSIQTFRLNSNIKAALCRFGERIQAQTKIFTFSIAVCEDRKVMKGHENKVSLSFKFVQIRRWRSQSLRAAPLQVNTAVEQRQVILIMHPGADLHLSFSRLQVMPSGQILSGLN